MLLTQPQPNCQQKGSRTPCDEEKNMRGSNIATSDIVVIIVATCVITRESKKTRQPLWSLTRICVRTQTQNLFVIKLPPCLLGFLSWKLRIAHLHQPRHSIAFVVFSGMHALVAYIACLNSARGVCWVQYLGKGTC